MNIEADPFIALVRVDRDLARHPQCLPFEHGHVAEAQPGVAPDINRGVPERARISPGKDLRNLSISERVALLPLLLLMAEAFHAHLREPCRIARNPAFVVQEFAEPDED